MAPQTRAQRRAQQKRTRAQQRAQQRCSPDMLSQMPVDIQARILSYLSTTDAARTGFCSKLLWAAWCSLSTLIFDFYQFPTVNHKADRFTRFIEHTLASHDDSDIKTFEVLLWPSIYCYIPIKHEWISFALARNVKNLVLCGRLLQGVKLPNRMFSCHSLVKLELAVERLLLEWPEDFELPKLQKLKLKFLLMSYPEVRRDLFSSFPALEKLSIMFCHLSKFTDGLYISSSKLTKFMICNSTGMENCKFTFDTPSLFKFVYLNPSERETELVIPKVHHGIIINAGITNVWCGSVAETERAMVKLTRELFKGSGLTFYLSIIEYLCVIHDLPQQVATFGEFNNLHILDVDIWPFVEHVIVVLLLIAKCPYLAALSFGILPPEREPILLPFYDQNFDNYNYEGGYRSLSHVNIKIFGGEPVELLLVETLLAHSRNLILMKIDMSEHMVTSEIHETITKIMNYKKASELANVMFY